MVETIEQKLIETSVQGVDKSRRNFLKYLTGGLVGTAVAGGLGYLGYERFREPSLREKSERASNFDDKLKILIETAYKNPEEVIQFFRDKEKNFDERYHNFDHTKYDKEKIEKYYKKAGINVELCCDEKKNKILIFIKEDIEKGIKEMLINLRF